MNFINNHKMEFLLHFTCFLCTRLYYYEPCNRSSLAKKKIIIIFFCLHARRPAAALHARERLALIG